MAFLRGISVNALAVLAAILVALSLVYASPVKAATLEQLKHTFKLQKDGSYGSLQATYGAVATLSVLEPSLLDPKTTCPWLLGSSDVDPVSAAYLKVQAAAALGCPEGLKIGKDSEALLLEALSGSARDIFLASAALATLKNKKWSSKSKDFSSAASSALKAIKGLAHKGGWKLVATDTQASPAAAAYVANAITSLTQLGASLPSGDAEDLSRSVLKVLTTSTVVDGDTSFVFDPTASAPSPLPLTSLFLQGLISLASGPVPLDLKPETTLPLASYLSSSLPALSAGSDLAAAIQALATLDDNSLLIPITVSVPASVELPSSSLKISVSTPLGRPVPGVSVSLVSATVDGSTLPAGSGKVLVAEADGTTFSSSLLAAKDSKPGAYSLKLEVSSSNPRYVAHSLSASVLASSSLSVSPITLAVLDSEAGKPAEEASLNPGQKASLSASHLQTLTLSLSLTDASGASLVPAQAFLSLTHESGVEHHFVLQASSDGQLQLKISILESIKKLFYLSGLYSLHLTVGDARMVNSFSRDLGTVDLDLPEAPESAPKPLAPLPPHSVRFGPQPEIQHIFRSPEARPPVTVSLAFTALVLLPFLGLLVGLAALRVNFNAFPASNTQAAAAGFAFHTGIALILALFVAFWVEVHLFTTLKLLLVVGIATAVPGHRILSYLANSSVKTKED